MKKQPAQLVAQWLSSCPPRQIYAALCVFGLVVFAGAVFHPFVHDDIFFIVRNPSVFRFDFRNVFLHPLDMGMAGVGINVYYRPLLDLVNHWQYLMFGFYSPGFHLFNIGLHIANSCLVFALAFRILEVFAGTTRVNARWAALITSVIFMVHPVQTQAVDCVSGISNLLFVCLGLSAFLLYLLARREARGVRCGLFYGLSLFVFALAILAKEQALVFPLLIAWFEICLGRRKFSDRLENDAAPADGRKRFALVSGWFLVILLYAGFKKFLLGSQPLVDGHFFSPEWWLRVSHIPRIFLINLGLVVFPKDLHYFRSIDILGPRIPSMILLSAVIAAAAVVGRRWPESLRRPVLFGCGWFVLAQMLTINILPLIWEYSYISVAEHFLYLPVIGIVLACAVVFLERFPPKFGDEWKAVIVIVLVAGCAALTIQQHRFWISEVALFERAARFEPGLGRVQMLLGQAYYADGQFQNAVKAYAAARERMLFYEGAAFGEKTKNFYRVMRKDIDRGLAVAYQALGDFPSAEQFFEEALRLAPEDWEAHNDLGVLYVMQGNSGAALPYFRNAFEAVPDNFLFLKNYALVLLATGDQAKAAALVEQRIHDHPNDDLKALLDQIEKSP